MVELHVHVEREAQGDFVNFVRMELAMFHELLNRDSQRLPKQHTKLKIPLQPGLKLAITLRYFATGNSYHSLSYAFRVPHNTISLFIREVYAAIIAEYEEEVVSLPYQVAAV